nr:iron and copper transporter IacT-like [Nerophis lumbriciformis]
MLNHRVKSPLPPKPTATAGLLLMMFAPLSAVAQATLEEIIVTAQKREQSVQDVPISITTVGLDALNNNIVNNVYDLQAAVPALQVQAVDPPGQGTAFALRGLGNSVFNLGFDPAVATFVDGIYRSRSGVIASSDFLDLERVEVLKGPQGTLFGKNTTAGVVHFVSRKPDFEGNSGRIEIGAEQYSRFRFKGSTNIVASDTAAFRIGATYNKGDGWLDLIGSGEEIHDRDRFTIKAQGLFQPAENLSIHLIADYSSASEICCTPLRNTNSPLAGPVNGPAAGAVGSGIVDPPNLDNLLAESNRPPQFEADDFGLSAEINWSIDDSLTLTSITGYRDYEDSADKDNDFTGVDVLRSNQDLPEVSLFSQELRLAGSTEFSSGRSFDWLVGGYYSQENIELVNEFIWGPQITLFPFFAPGLFGNTPGRAFLHNIEQEIDSTAIFAHGVFELTDAVNLTLGFRYSDDEKAGSMVSDHPLTNAFGLFNSLPLSVVYDYDTTFEDSEPTYSATIDWKPNDNSMLFATYSRGYKSGGISMTRDAAGSAVTFGDPMLGCAPGFTAIPMSPLCSGPVFDPTFEREEANHIEVGYKADLMAGRLRLNVAAWNTDFENLQTQTLRSDGAFAVVNIEGATSQGLEIETQFAATENLNLNASIQFLDATFDDGLPALTPGFSAPGRRPFEGSAWRFFASANAYYRTDYFNFTEPNPAFVQDGYTLVNLRLGVRNDNWDFAVWCRNCGDERVTWSNFALPFDGIVLAPPGTDLGTRFSHVAEPSIVGASANYRF